MKVLHIINGESYAGAERVQDLLAQRLPDHGVAVAFACLKPGVFAQRRVCRSTELELHVMRGRFDLSPALAIARWLRRSSFDLVHTHTPRSALIGRAASWLARVPMVHHVHSPTLRDTESALRNRVNAAVERFALAGASRLLPVSASLSKQLIASGVERERICLVRNGVPTPAPLPVRQAPGPQWTIGCVALFRPRKGLEILLDAVARLRESGKELVLRAVGTFESDAYRAAILARVRDLGIEASVEWVGFSADVHGEMLRMDVMVLPSLFGEGLPMVVLEAMVSGVPVIATEVEGTPEVIEHGRSGLLVRPGDALALCERVTDLMDGRHDWAAMREAAYQRQSTLFSDHAMAAGVAKVYRDVLGHA